MARYTKVPGMKRRKAMLKKMDEIHKRAIHLASKQARAADKRVGYVTACGQHALEEVGFLWDVPKDWEIIKTVCIKCMDARRAA